LSGVYSCLNAYFAAEFGEADELLAGLHHGEVALLLSNKMQSNSRLLLQMALSFRYALFSRVMRHKSLHQVVVLLLFAFALSEAALGEPCVDELSELNEFCVSASVSSSQPMTLDNDIRAGIAESSHSTPDEHSHCLECFCCCAHILPSPMFLTESVMEHLPPTPPSNCALPTSPSPDTFRPPRSA